MSLNSLTITGNLTENPVLRRTGDNTPVCNFTVAVTHREFRGGQWRDTAPVFKDVVVWRDKALNAAESLKGGMRVTVTGREKDASYTPRGSDTGRRAVVLVADDVALSHTYGTGVFTWADRRAERPAPAPVG